MPITNISESVFTKEVEYKPLPNFSAPLKNACGGKAVYIPSPAEERCKQELAARDGGVKNSHFNTCHQFEIAAQLFRSIPALNFRKTILTHQPSTLTGKPHDVSKK